MDWARLGQSICLFPHILKTKTHTKVNDKFKVTVVSCLIGLIRNFESEFDLIPEQTGGEGGTSELMVDHPLRAAGLAREIQRLVDQRADLALPVAAVVEGLPLVALARGVGAHRLP